ncbi:MAG: hypothetical protein SF028_06135 [Candidatus Sumerlaeia bacterium]|nr:hypothetical protein [Candidatus Sumerlaeia bacterium]
MTIRVYRARRGSTLLIVLGVLSLFILLVTTVSLSGRLDSVAAANYGAQVQDRFSTLTGVARTARELGASLPEGPSAALPARFAGGVSASAADGGVPPELQPLALGAMAQLPGARVEVRDAAGMVNLNTAPEPTLRALIAQVAAQRGIAVDADSLARGAAAWRLGPDGAPGGSGVDDDADEPELNRLSPDAESALARHGMARDTVRSLHQPTDTTFRGAAHIERAERLQELFNGVDDQDEFLADIRRPAHGDDRRYLAVEDLGRIEGFTPELIEALRPHATVFSVAQELRPAAEGGWKPLLDLNRATVEEIHSALRELYAHEAPAGTLPAEAAPGDDALLQFALNLVDARDPDRVPTRRAGSAPGSELFGFERTPLLTEAYTHPRQITLQTTDGQFAAIHNPWPEAFDLAGWSLRGAGGEVPLSGTIAPRGYLIVTNDKDNRNDSTPAAAGEGSLYDIFGVAEVLPARRILEARQFRMPNQPGEHEIALTAPGGEVVDRFAFTVTERHEAGVDSFQREALFSRAVTRGRARLFAAPKQPVASAEALARLSQYPPDMPFTATTQLFDVLAAIGPGSEQEDGVRFPAPGLRRGADAVGAELDARLLDIFTVETRGRRPAADVAANLMDQDGDGELNDAKRPRLDESASPLAAPTNWEDSRDRGWDLYFETPLGLRLGLVNLNTASREVLRSLPGVTAEQASHILERRSRAMLQGGGAMVYSRPSDLLADARLWELGGAESDAERLAAFSALYDEATFSTRSFVLVGRAGEQPNESGSTSQPAIVEALVATDRLAPHVVGLRTRREARR